MGCRGSYAYRSASANQRKRSDLGWSGTGGDSAAAGAAATFARSGHQHGRSGGKQLKEAARDRPGWLLRGTHAPGPTASPPSGVSRRSGGLLPVCACARAYYSPVVRLRWGA